MGPVNGVAPPVLLGGYDGSNPHPGQLLCRCCTVERSGARLAVWVVHVRVARLLLHARFVQHRLLPQDAGFDLAGLNITLNYQSKYILSVPKHVQI